MSWGDWGGVLLDAAVCGVLLAVLLVCVGMALTDSNKDQQ